MDKLRDINLFTIRVFVMVYESLNSLSVANSLNVAPSKVSRCLGALRHALGDQLFIRRQYGFEPTPTADKLYPYFQQIMCLAGQVCQSAGDQPSQQQHYIVYAPATLSCKLASELKRHAVLKQQELSLSVRPLSASGPDDILQGRADLMLSFKPSEKERLESRFIATGERLFVVARDEHPIWHRPANNMLDAIINYPFLVTECPAFNDRIDPLELYAMDHGRQLKIAGKAGVLSEVSDYLMESDAITFIGARQAAEFMQHIPGVSIREMSEPEFALLHDRCPPPKYYAIRRKEDGALPDWLLECVCELVTQSVTRPAKLHQSGASDIFVSHNAPTMASL
ncbi:LysR family transcriptional regulator [Ferrimonas balearica]|uniref:LysR family transcriptional regulator n=1 Tax=Ferrimonas balearica TaxID=44012 RepID=UPI001C99BD15|nr:LysR family transcriptional regulator [Ferrimonas balearica]MBY5993586.1 LysR family transcriptional regulator [Ferrimonas balearica]